MLPTSGNAWFAKGALHIHSTFSGDGELPLSEIKELFLRDGFQFLAICEHQHDVSAEKFEALVEECCRLTDDTFLVIPGIEFNCYRNHILGIGIDAYRTDVTGDHVLPWIKAHKGFAVWAHPKKNEYCLPSHVVDELDGMEIWNSKFDGKYAPRQEVLSYYWQRQALRPTFRPICGVDFHFRTQFRGVAMYCEVRSLTTDEVVSSLREGRYISKTPAVTVSGKGDVKPQGHKYRWIFNATNLWVFDCCKKIYRSLKRRHIVLPPAVRHLGRRLFS